MNRREMLLKTGAAALALGLSDLPLARAADSDKKKRILMYTRSQGFQHSVVTRGKKGELSLAERIVTRLGEKHGFEVVCEKDGRVFLSDEFPRFDGFFFETQGNLEAEQSKDGAPPMTPDGKKRLLEAVAGGKGFVGSHCASDTFHTRGARQWENQPEDKRDPYIRMVGGEFIKHGEQQKAVMHVADHHFPGLDGLEDFELHEEWYSLKNFAPNLHVILVQQTKGMRNFDYQRPPFPATWAHTYKRGRVFYTSMGHREDVWENATFQRILVAGLNWSLRKVDADVKPNLEKVAPHASELPNPKKK